MLWTVVIPAKALPGAKSRLVPATAGPDAHARLVAAIRADVVTAALAADGVMRVLIVADQPCGLGVPDPVAVLVQSRPGLNGALLDAAAHAVRQWPHDGVAALVGDLPALRPDDLGAALRAAADHPAAFVADAAGTGTTLLTAAPGTGLLPRFGPGSAGRHALAAVSLDAAPGLRRDVDVPADLDAAVALGLGPCTAAAWPTDGPDPGVTPGVHDEVA